MASLKSLLEREERLIERLESIDIDIKVKEEELESAKRMKDIEEDKLKQIRHFIKEYFNSLK